MKHLSIEEIIDFISLDEMNSETLSMAENVTRHIIECRECRKKVHAFQVLYDEFIRIKDIGKAKSIIYEIVNKKEIEESENTKIDIDMIQKEMDF